MGRGTRTSPPPCVSPSIPMSTLPPNRGTGTPDIEKAVLDYMDRSATKGVTVVATDELDLNDSSYCPTLAVIFTRHPTYRVRVSIGPSPLKLLPITAVIDSGAGFEIVNRDILDHLGWSTIVIGVEISRPRGANGGRLRLQGVIVIYVRLGELPCGNTPRSPSRSHSIL